MRLRAHTQPDRCGPSTRGILVTMLVLASGCGTQHAEFRPVEASRELAPGYVAAYYEIDKDDRNYGDIKIWSPGAYPAEMNGEAPAIHVRLRVRNDSDQPMSLDLGGTNVEVTTEDRGFFVIGDEARAEGTFEVAAGSVEHVDLYYALPGELDPDQIEAFELNWKLQTPAGPVTQSTPFTQDEKEARTYWVPYYGFGPGFGWGWPSYRYWR